MSTLTKKRIALMACGLLAMQTTYAQLVYNNGADIKITAGLTVQINGDLVNSATGNISNDGTIVITGNVQNNQTGADGGDGSWVLAGGSTQSVAGTAPLTVKDLELNNSAGMVLTAPLKVEGVVSFKLGILSNNSATNALILTSTATISSTDRPTDVSHVDGFVVKEGTGSFTYPTGNGTKYQPITANLTANASGMRVRYYAADAGLGAFSTAGSEAVALSAYNAAEYWDLTPLSTATGSVTVYWDGHNDSDTDPVENQRVAHKVASNWLNEGGVGTGTIGSGSVTSNSLTSWSPVALGRVSSVLPVELRSFAGRHETVKNTLTWETAIEANTAYYDIERRTPTGQFAALGQAKATGSYSNYKWQDWALLPTPIAYYRLKMVDADGKFTYSKTIALEQGQRKSIQTYPNPVQDVLTVAGLETAQSYEVVNAAGQVLVSGRLDLQNTTIDMGSLPQGSYIVKIGETAQTIVKQ